MIFLCNPTKTFSQYWPPLTNICLHFEERVMLPPLTHSIEGQTLPLLMTNSFETPDWAKGHFSQENMLLALTKGYLWGCLLLELPLSKTDAGKGSSRAILITSSFGYFLCLLPAQLFRIKQKEEMGTSRLNIISACRKPSQERNPWHHRNVTSSLWTSAPKAECMQSLNADD